jgi:hypothetical protein
MEKFFRGGNRASTKKIKLKNVVIYDENIGFFKPFLKHNN